jgi:acid phosphatase
MAATACGASAGPTADSDSSAPVVHTPHSAFPTPSHVLVVIFENKGASQVIGNPAAPYLTSLAKTGAYFAQSHGIAHPSEPNYLALFSGSAHGVHSDACPIHLHNTPNLARQLLNKHRTFTGYAESLPAAGYAGCSAGDYARKHAPWTDFGNLPKSIGQPYAKFPSDFAALPTVAFLVPNLCNDMHNCSVGTGDRWAKAHLSRYVAWARTSHSLLIVTFDEDDDTSANHIATLLVGPMVRPGTYRQSIDHYNVLRTLEQMYGLAPLGLAQRAHTLECWKR